MPKIGQLAVKQAEQGQSALQVPLQASAVSFLSGPPSFLHFMSMGCLLRLLLLPLCAKDVCGLVSQKPVTGKARFLSAAVYSATHVSQGHLTGKARFLSCSPHGHSWHLCKQHLWLSFGLFFTHRTPSRLQATPVGFF